MSPSPVRTLMFVTALAVLILVSCSVGDDVLAPAATSTNTEPTRAPRASTTPSTTAQPTTMDQPTTSEAETIEVQAEDQRPNCRRLSDFEDDGANQRWLVVNDDVMGGRSLGGLSFEDGTLVFEGAINTNGGGFSSLRLPLEPEALVDRDRVEFRARPDGRSYMVTFDDELPRRDRRVSHRAPIGFGPAGEWQTVSVSFDDLFPAVFGQPIEDLPFRRDLATRMGLMISDGLDGPFRLEVDWIDLCAPG